MLNSVALELMTADALSLHFGFHALAIQPQQGLVVLRGFMPRPEIQFQPIR